MLSHPMRLVTRRTGLSADVIRAWETRYQAVTPHRSEGGQRRYSDDDVERLTLLTRVTALGRNISQVARLRTDQLRTLLMDDAPAIESPAGPHGERDAAEMRAAATSQVEAFDERELETALRRGVFTLGLDAMIDGVIIPMMEEIDGRRDRSAIAVAHARFAADVVARVLAWVRETGSGSTGAPHIALAATEGARGELGIQVVGAVAATLGWRVSYLGSELPAGAIVAAARRGGARVLALSGGFAGGMRRAREQLAEIREGLPEGVAIITGSAGTAPLPSELADLGVTVLPSPEALRAFLRSYF